MCWVGVMLCGVLSEFLCGGEGSFSPACDHHQREQFGRDAGQVEAQPGGGTMCGSAVPGPRQLWHPDQGAAPASNPRQVSKLLSTVEQIAGPLTPKSVKNEVMANTPEHMLRFTVALANFDQLCQNPCRRGVLGI